jgi:hypothetical protein
VIGLTNKYMKKIRTIYVYFVFCVFFFGLFIYFKLKFQLFFV